MSETIGQDWISVTIALFITCGFITNPGQPARAADSIYEESGQPPFKILVPDGWTATRQPHSLRIQRGSTYFVLTINNGWSRPSSMLAQYRLQFQRQWKGFSELNAGEAAFGGQPGAYIVFSGVSPSGIFSVERVVVTTNVGFTFTAFEGSSRADMDQAKPLLEKIERSFAPGPFHMQIPSGPIRARFGIKAERMMSGVGWSGNM